MASLLERAENVLGIYPCEECGHSLVLHLLDHYGCEYDRGDGWVTGNQASAPTVLCALGPCGCKAENLSDDGKDAFLLLRDLRQARISEASRG